MSAPDPGLVAPAKEIITLPDSDEEDAAPRLPPQHHFRPPRNGAQDPGHAAPGSATLPLPVSDDEDDVHRRLPWHQFRPLSRSAQYLGTVSCIACGESPVPLHPLPCGHSHCSNCLTLNFTWAVTSKPFQPPRCCPACVEIPVDILRVTVKGDVADVAAQMAIYLPKLEEYNCTKKMYCHVRVCSVFIPVGRRSLRVGTCPQCAAKTCKKCKAKSHWGACSAEALAELQGDKQLLSLAESNKWKKCPACKAMVEKTGGCTNMSCICGCHFCYACGLASAGDHRCEQMGGVVQVQD